MQIDCRVCKNIKPISEFNKRPNRPRGYYYHCKDCASDFIFKRKYGMYRNDINKLLDAQDGKCAICCTDIKGDRRSDPKFPNVDHDHITGKVRGLLCQKCNLGLGNFKDSISLLQQALDYLRKSL